VHALCFTSNKHLLQLYQMVTNLRFEAPTRSILCIPQKSPPHTIECVICIFGLVLIWCWCLWVLACSRPACICPFHPIAKITLFNVPTVSSHASHWRCTIPSMCDNCDCALSCCDTAISLRHGSYTLHMANIKDFLYCIYEQ